MQCIHPFYKYAVSLVNLQLILIIKSCCVFVFFVLLFLTCTILILECSKTARAVKLHTENLDARKEKDEAKAEMKRLQVCLLCFLSIFV